MGDDGGVEEGRGTDAFGAIDDLGWEDEGSGGDVLAEGADGGEGEDGADAEGFEGGDVGAGGDGGGWEGVSWTVAG